MGSFEKGAAEVAMLGVGEVWCGSAEGEEGSPIFPFLDLQRWRHDGGEGSVNSNEQWAIVAQEGSSQAFL
jgi:hypothetical protein